MTTPDYSTPLVDLSEVKDHLNIPSSDTSQDDELQGFIEAASAYIQNLTGPITEQTFTEVHSGGRPLVFVFNPPILSVTSVVEYVAQTGYTLTEVSLGDVTGQYSFSVDSPRSGGIRRRYSGGVAGCFAGGDHNIAVTYTSGLPFLPADIRMAVLQDIAGLFQPSQLGGNPYGGTDRGNGPINPVGMFPRVTEVLSAPSMRTPAIG